LRSGFDRRTMAALLELKNVKRGRISELAAAFGLEFRAGQTPWSRRATSRCRAPRRTNWTPSRPHPAAQRLPAWPKAPTCRPRWRLWISLSRPAFCSPRARRPTPVGSRSAGWKCRRTPCACCGPQVRWTASCTHHAVDPPRLRALRRRGRADQLRQGANIAGFVKVADAMLAQGVV
jgi:glutamate dehydrogenase (NADP+)